MGLQEHIDRLDTRQKTLLGLDCACILLFFIVAPTMLSRHHGGDFAGAPVAFVGLLIAIAGLALANSLGKRLWFGAFAFVFALPVFQLFTGAMSVSH